MDNLIFDLEIRKRCLSFGVSSVDNIKEIVELFLSCSRKSVICGQILRIFQVVLV